MNRELLWKSMIERKIIAVSGIMKSGLKVNVTGIVNRLEVEDGSGKCFFVQVHNFSEPLFVRTAA